MGQIILRWHIQEGIIPIPKASSQEHIQENINIFDFNLADDGMVAIRKMDKGFGIHDPEDMNQEVRLRKLKIHNE